jgi:hypothetical protein
VTRKFVYVVLDVSWDKTSMPRNRSRERVKGYTRHGIKSENAGKRMTPGTEAATV